MLPSALADGHCGVSTVTISLRVMLAPRQPFIFLFSSVQFKRLVSTQLQSLAPAVIQGRLKTKGKPSGHSSSGSPVLGVGVVRDLSLAVTVPAVLGQTFPVSVRFCFSATNWWNSHQGLSGHLGSKISS